ncbi:MAG TPA: helix-turn-helix domain-containing protein [Candidatus Alistipes faecavium]|nr:helix-turn-helix domain-containing protein [Candidatus Alistipes faecavium]
MPLDYLNEASDEVQRLFTRLDDVERTLREASEEHHPMIGEERYLTGEEVCTRLHLSPRTLQTLRDRRQIPFTVLGNRLLLYPESGILLVLDRNLRPAAGEFPL